MCEINKKIKKRKPFNKDFLLSFISKHSFIFIIKLYYSSHHISFYRYLNFMIFYSFNLIFAFSFITNKILKSSKLNYCIVFLRDSTEQHSTCMVALFIRFCLLKLNYFQMSYAFNCSIYSLMLKSFMSSGFNLQYCIICFSIPKEHSIK